MCCNFFKRRQQRENQADMKHLSPQNTPTTEEERPLMVVDMLTQGIYNEQYLAEVEAMRRAYEFNYNQCQGRLQEDEQSMSSIDIKTFTEIFNLPTEKLRSPTDVLRMKHYRLEKKVGNGAYGTVWKARFQMSPSRTTTTNASANNPKTSNIVACKVITYNRSRRQKLLKVLKSEIFVLEKYPHPNIITLLEHFVIEDTQHTTAYLIMEFADGGSLSDLLENVGPLTESCTYEYFVQILKGVFYLHTFHIAHRDLKTDNVLLVYSKTDTGVKIVKITDFGLSKQMYKREVGYIKPGDYAGTRCYMAPEILRRDLYPDFKCQDINAFKADIWALGVILQLMLYGQNPFELSSSERIYETQIQHLWSFPEEPILSDNVKNLIDSMLQISPKVRIDPFGIWMHPWIQISYMTNQGWRSTMTANSNVQKHSPIAKVIHTMIRKLSR